MKLTILAFSVVKEIFHGNSIQIELPQGATTADLKALLNSQYPALLQLATYLIAVNNKYSTEQKIIQEGDEIAIIPPVSGG